MPEPESLNSAPEGVAVVTVRQTATTQNATYELLEILSEITSVALLTTVIARESPICGQFEYAEISDRGTGGPVHEAGLQFILNQIRFCIAISRRDEEAILFFGATAYILPILFARLIGRIVIVEPRGDVPLTLRLHWEETLPTPIAGFLASLVRVLERTGYRLSTAIITYTPAMADELSVNRYSGKVYTMGARHVPIERFDLEIPFDERDRRIGYVGRLDIEKGMPILVDVIKHLPEDISFTFVGDGSYRDRIESRLEAEIQAGKVEITGWLDQSTVPSQLNRLQLLVMPSKPTEGLPTTILEAFACGTPVYATPVSGIPDVVREAETGFLMDSTEPVEIAERIQSIMDRDDLSRMSQNCREMIEQEYRFRPTVERYRTMFDEIMCSK